MLETLKIDPRLNGDKVKEVLDYPEVIRVIKFDEESCEKFQHDLNSAVGTGQEVVPVVVDSFGGQIYTVMGMIAAIEQCPVPVATILTTKAMSCGSALFCFGTEGYRYMHPDATIMIHDASWGSHGKVEDVKNDAQHLEDMNKRLFKKMAKQIGHPPDYILNLIREHSHVDWFLSAKEAKRHNIANHLKIPSLQVEVTVQVNFG